MTTLIEEFRYPPRGPGQMREAFHRYAEDGGVRFVSRAERPRSTTEGCPFPDNWICLHDADVQAGRVRENGV